MQCISSRYAQQIIITQAGIIMIMELDLTWSLLVIRGRVNQVSLE